MTRAELLRALIRQAKMNGFEFRKWYVTRITLPWKDFGTAVKVLAEERRYYSLLFSHEFAQAFWKSGSKMAFVVPNISFTRILKDGSTKVVERRGHTRRTVRPDAWRYHLKEMATAADPLRYIRRFMLIEEDLVGIQAMSDEEDPNQDAGSLPVEADEVPRSRDFARRSEDVQPPDEDFNDME